MKKEYSFEIIEGFTQSQKGDYHLVRYKFPRNDGFQVCVKISNLRKFAWEKSYADIDWERCLCYIAIMEGLEKQQEDFFLKEDVSPQQCPWPNIRNNFGENICFIESPDPPFGFHSKENE